METLSKPERATYFVAYGPNATHTGIVEPNQVVVTGQPSLETTADENEYLGLLAPVSNNFPPLPPMGTQLEKGEIYLWGGIAVMVRQSHVRTEHDPDTVPNLFLVYRTDGGIEWIYPEQVYIGTRRTRNGILYEAIQKHVTQSDWAPEITVGNLWKVVEEQGGGTAWVDTGVTIAQLVASGVYRVSGVPTLTLNQDIRLGDLQAGETVFTGYWPTTGTPSDYIKISPHVTAANGAKVWKWA